MTHLSYHNHPGVKAKFQARYERLRAAGRIFQACPPAGFVASLLGTCNPERFPVVLGWPVWLGHLSEKVFNGLEASEAPQFGTDLLDKVPVGCDLQLIMVPFLIRIQKRNLAALPTHSATYVVQCRSVIQDVIEWLEHETPAKSADALESACLAAFWAAQSMSRVVTPEMWHEAWSASRCLESAEETVRSVVDNSLRPLAYAASSSEERQSVDAQAQRADLFEVVQALN